MSVKLDAAIIPAPDQCFVATNSHGCIANKAYNSKKLQQKIRAWAAKFVQNADIQKQAKKRWAT